MKKGLMRFAIATGLTIGVASAGLAAEGNDVALTADAVKLAGTEIIFNLPDGAHNVTVSVAGPRGYRARAYFPDGAAFIDLSEHGELSDGAYKYEMTGASDQEVEFSNASEDGRAEDDGRTPKKSLAMNGFFRVAKGAIVVFKDIKETE